ncbi:unnamed protein product [Rotaria sordida]|uniref:Uncharacterized protein n=1 Tax=Rotaria sordida TaxID=392033 RepID=A0A813RUL0_9BILA|nr:unnamed protein product [Rotaria sordida]
MHANRCIVYYDKYIDCKIRAPITIQAINNRLTYMFHCIERRLYLQSKVYRQHPKLLALSLILRYYSLIKLELHQTTTTKNGNVL